MTIIIELRKVTQEDIKIFLETLNYYATHMQFMHEALLDVKYAKDMSIAVETWYEFNKKTVGQFPKQTCSFKLSLHKAYVMRDALISYMKETKDDYQRNRCNRYLFAIDEQLPTATQLSLK